MDAEGLTELVDGDALKKKRRALHLLLAAMAC
jgi:hypothetical protein